MLFFVKTAEVEQIQALYGAYKNRIRFFDGDKPYFAVTLEKKQDAEAVWQDLSVPECLLLR